MVFKLPGYRSLITSVSLPSGLVSSAMNLVSGQRCSQSSSKWKSNHTQSASHRLSAKNPSKVTLDEEQPSALCSLGKLCQNNFIHTLLCRAEVGIKTDFHVVPVCAGQTEYKCSVCSRRRAWWTRLHSLPLTFLLLRSWEMCLLALKEEFHLILAPCFPSVHFCNAQLSKHEELLDIRRQHLSPCTHKPLNSGSFSVFVRDYLLTLWLLQQATRQLSCYPADTVLIFWLSLCGSLVSPGYDW